MSQSRAGQQAQGSQNKRNSKFTLGIGDYLVILPIILTIAGLIISDIRQLNGLIQSIDNRVNLLQNSTDAIQSDMTDIKVSVAQSDVKINQLVSGVNELKEVGIVTHLPSPNVSTIWFALRAGDKPFSEYIIDEDVWSGVWVDFAEIAGGYLHFDNIEYTLISTDTLPGSLLELNYVVIIAKVNDPLANRAVSQGWSQKPFDPYFKSAGFGPYDYSILLSPKLVDSGFEVDFLTALSEVPTNSWTAWGETIEKIQP